MFTPLNTHRPSRPLWQQRLNKPILQENSPSLPCCTCASRTIHLPKRTSNLKHQKSLLTTATKKIYSSCSSDSLLQVESFPDDSTRCKALAFPSARSSLTTTAERSFHKEQIHNTSPCDTARMGSICYPLAWYYTRNRRAEHH